MSSKAQIKASNKYNKENTVQYCIRLNKRTDAKVIKKLDEQENKTAYIKSLIQREVFKDYLNEHY